MHQVFRPVIVSCPRLSHGKEGTDTEEREAQGDITANGAAKNKDKVRGRTYSHRKRQEPGTGESDLEKHR